VLSNLAYLTLCRSIQLLVLLARGDAAKDLEILVLRHQLGCAAPPDPTTQIRTCRPRCARRHQPCVAPSPLVVLPRQAGDAAALAPAAGRRRPDLPAPRTRATPAQPGAAAADRPLGQGEPSLGTSASRANSSTWASGSRPPRSAPRCAVMGWTRRRDRRPPAGGRSCASRQPASSRATSSPSTPSGFGGCMCCSSSNWPPAGSTWPASPPTPTVAGSPSRPNLFLATADGGLRLRFVLRDRDAKVHRGCDDVFRAEGAEVVVTPVQAPNANADAERWIRTVRAECLDWLLVVGRGHLEQVLRIYVEHYNRRRPHRALGLDPPGPSAGLTLVGEARRARVRRRDLLGGLLHEYRRAA
jgi:hypothetical protein